MERFLSTLAFGLEVICLGSVTAWGAGRICVAATVVISMTIANRKKVRMRTSREGSKRKCNRASCGDLTRLCAHVLDEVPTRNWRTFTRFSEDAPVPTPACFFSTDRKFERSYL